jgi:hypothetical protein
MPSEQDIQHQQELLLIHRNHLAEAVKQQAIFGAALTPQQILARISEERSNVRRIKTILRSWEVSVEDLPDDEAPASHPSAT